MKIIENHKMKDPTDAHLAYDVRNKVHQYFVCFFCLHTQTLFSGLHVDHPIRVLVQLVGEARELIHEMVGQSQDRVELDLIANVAARGRNDPKSRLASPNFFCQILQISLNLSEL